MPRDSSEAAEAFTRMSEVAQAAGFILERVEMRDVKTHARQPNVRYDISSIFKDLSEHVP